jgi:hypothetical protein
MEQARDCLVESDAGRDEDGQHDGDAREFFCAERAHQERDPEWQGGQRVPEVVDQVGEQRDRPGEREDRRLGAGGNREQPQTQSDGLQPLAGADDRAVDESVGVPVTVLVQLGVGPAFQDASLMRSASPIGTSRNIAYNPRS